MDLYGPLPKGLRGNRYLLVTIDVFSKYTMLYPVQKATARYIAKRLKENIIPLAGKPEYLLTDHGTQFTSAAFKRIMEDLNIRHVLSSIRHPESNPAERVMSELGKFFRMFCPEHHWKWVEWLPKVAYCINSTVHESTKQIPMLLHLGQKPRRPWEDVFEELPEEDIEPTQREEEARQTMYKSAEKRLKRVKNKRYSRPLEENQLVLVRTLGISNPKERVYSKFIPLYKGPYRISRCFSNNAYELETISDGRIIGRYNAASLKRYHTPDE